MTELAQADAPVELRATPVLVGKLELLEDLDSRLAKLREREDELEAEREDTCAQLAKSVELGWWKIGPFTLRRTLVTPRPSIDAWRAIDEGAVAEAVLRPYMTERRPFERWTLGRRRRRSITA